MDTLKERQLTVRASRRPVEYNYTNADIHHVDTEPHTGYQFEYPLKWSGDQSTNKVIGIRRISYKPTSIDLAVTFIVDIGAQDELELTVVLVFTDQNTFEECISSSSSSITPSAAGLCPLRRWFGSARDRTTNYPTGMHFYCWR